MGTLSPWIQGLRTRHCVIYYIRNSLTVSTLCTNMFPFYSLHNRLFVFGSFHPSFVQPFMSSFRLFLWSFLRFPLSRAFKCGFDGTATSFHLSEPFQFVLTSNPTEKQLQNLQGSYTSWKSLDFLFFYFQDLEILEKRATFYLCAEQSP